MKLLFASSDVTRIEIMRRNLTSSGVACEVHVDTSSRKEGGIPFYPELWIKHERDYIRAAKLLVRTNAGKQRNN